MKSLIVLVFVLAGPIAGLNGQDLFKDISKLDPGTSAGIMTQISAQHADYLLKVHTDKLNALEKSGVQIIRADGILTVDRPVKIVFAWPVSAGQKDKDKSPIDRNPQVLILYPAKNDKGLDAPQKWDVSFTKGTVTALP
jgi:hypothetical protein